MRYFRIVAENAAPGARPLAWLEGHHRWMLPSRIGCPDCTIYNAVGPAHPAVDLTSWSEAEAFTEPTSASWRQFRALTERLAPFVPTDVLLQPGAQFGPFTGRARGGPADFVFGPIHLLFATPSVASGLAEAGIALPPVVPARLRGRGSAPTDLVEFDVPRGGQLALEGFTLRASAPCATCGRWDRTLARTVLEEGTTPDGADLLRPVNHPTVVLASERFAAAVRSLELTGIAFETVDIVVPDT
jgi:uncharacterized double-CXXCG motif protein